jgi:hypothetical protein
MRTNREIKMHWRGHDLVIPKWTRVTNQTASGNDPNYYFIDEFGWIGKENVMLTHDAVHRGISIDPDYVDKHE